MEEFRKKISYVEGCPINFYSTYLFLYSHCFIMLNTMNGKGSICQ